MKKELTNLLTLADHSKRLKINGAFEVRADYVDKFGTNVEVSKNDPDRVILYLVYTLAHDKALFRSVKLEGKSHEELIKEIPVAVENILDGIKDDLLNSFRNGYLLGNVSSASRWN